MTTYEFSQQFTDLDRLLHSFAYRLTQNSEDAKDLYQETAMKAYKNRDKFKMGTNFKGWVSVIMRNTFINQYRKKKKRKLVSEPVDSFLYGLENVNSIPNGGEVNLRVEEIEQALDAIPDKYSVPFLMYFRGYEYQEIAQQMEIPLGTVKSRLFTARKKLKAKIKR